MVELTKVDSLPPLVRGGGKRMSEEAQAIVEALKSGDSFKIPNIDTDTEYNATQQRIRSAAKSAGLNVTIRRAKSEEALYFQGSVKEHEEVATEEVVEGNSKTKASK